MLSKMLLPRNSNIKNNIYSLRSLGSAALNICFVARGACDLYFEYGLHIWDIAAASLIAKEAGCVVSGADGQTLDLLNRNIAVACTKELADQVLPHLTHIPYQSD